MQQGCSKLCSRAREALLSEPAGCCAPGRMRVGLAACCSACPQHCRTSACRQPARAVPWSANMQASPAASAAAGPIPVACPVHQHGGRSRRSRRGSALGQNQNACSQGCHIQHGICCLQHACSRWRPCRACSVPAVNSGHLALVAVNDGLLLSLIQGPDRAGRDEPGARSAQRAGPHSLREGQEARCEGLLPTPALAALQQHGPHRVQVSACLRAPAAYAAKAEAVVAAHEPKLALLRRLVHDHLLPHTWPQRPGAATQPAVAWSLPHLQADAALHLP